MAAIIFPMGEQYEEYLTDESKYRGYADSISFPETEEEMQEILCELGRKEIPVTIQGGKTGITGGAIPHGGHIMNLSRMNRVKDSWMEEDGTGRIVVEPGINLIDLRKELANRFRRTPQIWPVDPTETSAAVGGIAASGAQGICRLLYGSSEQYIESVKLMDYAGKTREIRFDGLTGEFGDKEIRGGQAVFGREGITGIITELTLKLLPKPEAVWGIAFFFASPEEAAGFTDAVRSGLPKAEGAALAALEYMDRVCLDMIENRKSTMTKIRELPDVGEAAALVYAEIHGVEDAVGEIAEQMMETAMEYGSDPEQAWAVTEEAEIEKLHVFRHAAAETVNLFIEEKHREDGRITKLGADMAAEGRSFAEVLSDYEKSMEEAGLTGCIFGHALENHLHVNLLPGSYEEYCQGILYMRERAAQNVREHGKLIGEHGVGKLKAEMLGDMIPEAYTAFCRRLKLAADPENRINRDNIFS